MVAPLDPLADAFPEYAVAITQLLYFLLAFIGVYLLGKLLLNPIVDRSLNRRGLDEHAKRPLQLLLRFVVVFSAIAIAFGFAGYGNFLTSLATVAAAATLAIGLAMQDVLGNVVAGIFIYTDEPFRIGDWIEWGDYEGVVEDISLRVTRVRTFDNELLTVPNAELTTGVIKNPVAKEKLRQKFVFGIGYEDDIQEATDIILEEAASQEGILEEPAPVVRLTELADSYVGLRAQFWIDDPSRSDYVRVRGNYVTDVKARFDDAGITIPYPQRELSGGMALETGSQVADAEELAGDGSGD